MAMEASAPPTGAPEEDDGPLPSCHGCRTRKLKCSRETPSCSNCSRQAVPCTYDSFRTKPGLKRGTILKLQRRIESLESKVYASEDDGPSPQSRPPRADSRLDGSIGAGLSLLAQEIQKLSSNISILSQPVVPSPETPASRSLGKRRRIDGEHHSGRAAVNSSDDAPPADHLWAVADLYFPNLHPWIPMIHTETFKRNLRLRDGTTENPLILHAMLFGVLRFLDPPGERLSADRIEEEMERSRNSVILEATSTLTVPSLQALTIVAFTHVSNFAQSVLIALLKFSGQIGNGELLKAWPIIASLTRTVSFLQLSVEEEDRNDPETFLRPSLLPPSPNWIEEEERRRTFWNIFILDRWQTGLTADNVSRRLPLCGTRWNQESFAVSPFFGIWDRSAAKIGNSIAFLPANYTSPEASGTESEHGAPPSVQPQTAPKDMPILGAFAYYIESLESLCRINMYFLQQKIDFSNHQEVSNWLMRFKELDLRLVHWKMFLPPKWRDPNVPPEETTALDPNMTLAHITHNTSMILLHQRIGYPEPELMYIKLPSTYSAETCQSAAAETANITSKYLLHAPQHMPLSPFFSFCAYISARVLLVQARYYNTELDCRFQVLLDALRDIARRWSGFREHDPSPSLSTQFVMHLEELRHRSLSDPNFTVSVIGSLHRGSNENEEQTRNSVRHLHFPPGANSGSQPAVIVRPADFTTQPQLGKSPTSSSHAAGITTPGAISSGDTGEGNWTSTIQAPGAASAMCGESDELPSILQSLTDQRFIEMDRVITFNDFNFEPISTQISQMPPPPMNNGWVGGEGGWDQS
ncbi:uncharacterized protein BP5553_08794 [Venustampulla echinocandica]|uniref:Zn(2)-C6 fungal-type domain-containing protein n=1 Tax=Venustampulla echinocandica TaxID=2656787 RepID=A0A370TF98_9HELO|nr:uncharacterized protein BP5553_08794 [Venustampulla echinocandica]RDL33355.1 hypothetical protein BP5553_08794 [Venustampulla echinocandica]